MRIDHPQAGCHCERCERKRAHYRAWAKRNRQKTRELSKAWKEANPEKRRESQRRRYWSDPERFRAQRELGRQRWRERATPEEIEERRQRQLVAQSKYNRKKTRERAERELSEVMGTLGAKAGKLIEKWKEISK